MSAAREVVVGLAADVRAPATWEYALDVAHGTGSRLKVLMVNDSVNREALMFVDGDVIEEIMDRARGPWTSRADEIEQRLSRKARERHQKLEVVRHEGRFVDSLLAAGEDAWLTVVGRGRHAAEHPGSLGDRVEVLTRRLPGALLVTPSVYERPERVVAAYAAKQLGERVLELASDLARALEVPLVVLTAGDDRERIREIQDRAREWLASRDVLTDFIGASGRPDAAILSKVSESDLLVLGPHGRSPLYRMLLGRVTDRVIRGFAGPLALAARRP